MLGTIENTHTKITEKLKSLRTTAELLEPLSVKIKRAAKSHIGRKYENIVSVVKSIDFPKMNTDLNVLERDYNLSVVNILTDYYQNNDENANTKKYYRVIMSENFLSRVTDLTNRSSYIVETLHKILENHIVCKVEKKNIECELNDVSKIITSIHSVKINNTLEKNNYEKCKCGYRMYTVPELSELRCANPDCSKVKNIIGTIFRDEQYHSQDGQKSKHGGYDTSRHYRFWMERLQALETKTFSDKDMENIEYIISRDGYTKYNLSCETMREILKDPLVGATHLNDHAPLLVKTFGGISPPQLDFQENRLCSIRFNKVMKLYDVINPEGGNKPYYPYFIYKILEHMFKDCEKIRLLDYIHLQSRETVIKNDKDYEKICNISDESDGLVYKPTDPAGRL